jgi:fructuronate reductase
VARLSLSTVDTVDASRRPRVDPRELRVGIVHLGLGAFHRAHQATFTEDAVAAAGGDWGICGVSQRSSAVIEQLAPQDGLYTVLAEGEARVVGTERDLLFAGTQGDRVVARMADPAVRITTLTVTEKGYRHDPATGRLRGDDVTRADAAAGMPRTVVGQVVRGLQARMNAGAGPHTVLSCDNLAGNGRTLAGLVGDFLDLMAASDPLRAWIDEHVSFPNCMVDRITPATTDADRDEARALIGLDDEGVVVTESFRQWVIEDDFRAGRPAWERAGALLVDDVTPYEVMKLRLLNGAHSTLAYLGALAGLDTIAETMARDAFATVVRRLMNDDVAPTLDVPADFDLKAYQEQLLDRFANPALRHRTVQVAMDGSQKLPQRLLGTIRDRRSAGAQPRWAAFAVAAWMRWVQTASTLDDPLAPLLRRTLAGASAADDVVRRLLGVREVFGDDLRDDTTLRDLLVDALERIGGRGALAAAQSMIEVELPPYPVQVDVDRGERGGDA